MQSAIGGGPLLVTAGKPVFRARESFGDPVLNRRSARAAVGQLSDGRILLATVEGGSSAYSAGMTNYELAVALARLGVRTAMGLGTGPSAAMAFDGTLLTRPTADAEQQISDALFFSYNGVYAAPPSSTTLSPNGDGIDDVQTFTLQARSRLAGERGGRRPRRRDGLARAGRGAAGRAHGAVERRRRRGGRLALRRHRARRHGAHDDCRPHLRAEPDARLASGRAQRHRA